MTNSRTYEPTRFLTPSMIPPMTRYGRSPWVDRFPKSRVPDYPKHRGPLTTDVVIVGGGLTGCATAYAFAAAGIKVVLLEADRIGRGSSASAFGWIADAPGPSFQRAADASDSRRRGVPGSRGGARRSTSVRCLRRLQVKCELAPTSTLRVARTPEEVLPLKRELKARRAGRYRGDARQRRDGHDADRDSRGRRDPHARRRDHRSRTARRSGWRRAAAARGSSVFERLRRPQDRVRSEGRRRRDRRRHRRADRVVIATGRPTPLFKALVRHFWYQSTYFALTEPVPAKIRRSSVTPGWSDGRGRAAARHPLGR